MESYAHLFGLPTPVAKANPYHDHLGRFSTANGAHYVSTGAAFRGTIEKLRARMAKAQQEDVFSGAPLDSLVATAEASTRLSEATKGMYNKLSDSEKQILKHYTGDLHGELNPLLGSVGGDIAKLDIDRVGQVAALDGALAKMRLPEDTVLYRAVNLGHSGFAGFFNSDDKDTLSDLVGHVYTDRAYSSSSLSPETARGFQSFDKVMVEIRASKGTPGAFVGGHFDNGAVDIFHENSDRSKYPGEKEFVLPRNSKFLITGTREMKFKSNGGYEDTYHVVEVDLL